MKKLITVLFLLLFISCDTEHAMNSISTENAEITQSQSEIIFEKCKLFPNNSQVSIAIIQDGNTIFFGLRRVNDTIIQISNQNSVFEIGSISKVLTSTVLANAILENKVDLDDPINEFLDFKLKDNTTFTLKQLANHTSGLPRAPTNVGPTFNQDKRFQDYDEAKLKEYLTEDLRLQFEPGERTRYSNLGAGILGFVLTKIYSTDYEDLTQRYISNKYQMKSTTSERDKIVKQLVVGQDEDGDPVDSIEIGTLVGAGGLYSSVSDLSRFVLAQFDPSNKELELTRKKTFKIDEEHDRGLAWRIIKSDSGKTYYFHNGGTGGYKSFLEIDVINKNGIVILSNVSGHSKSKKNIDELGFELMRSLK